SSVPDPGKTTPVMFDPPAVITTIRACAIRRTAYALHIPYRRRGYEKYARNLGCCLAAGLPIAAYSQGTQGPADAYLCSTWPAEGRTGKERVGCRFVRRSMSVTQAGSNTPNSGHKHLLIGGNERLDPGEPIPQDKTHLHFGAGQTEARIELAVGKHTL